MTDDSASSLTYRTIRADIERGVYAAGTRLPSERLLANQLHVSRATLRIALKQLAAEGTLQNFAQRGWFVPRHPVGEPPSVLQSFSEMAVARGLRPTAKILARQERPATLSESERLHVAPVSPVLEIVRLRGLDTTVVCVDTEILPLPMAAPLVAIDLDDRSLYEALRDNCGVDIHRSAYTINAQAASSSVSDLLNVPVGWPVLVADEITYSLDERPISLGHMEYRGDAYKFQADLFRGVSA